MDGARRTLSEGDGPPECAREYDSYRGVRALVPYARGVGARSYRFDEEGALPADEGIMPTRRLLERVGAELS